MTQTGRVQILFPTSYSDSCFRAIRAVAQLVDTLDADLTLLHAFDPKSIGRRAAEEELASFFAEADNYRNSRRVAVEGDVNRAVLDFCRANPVHLAVVPSAQQLWLPRLRHRSRRAAMLEYGETPLWTIGKIVEEFDFRRPVRRIAAWVDFQNGNVNHIRHAAQLAARSNALLQLVHLLPEVHEGTIATSIDSDSPLHESVAAAEIEKIANSMQIQPDIHVAVGSRTRGLPALLSRIGTDLLYLGEGQVLRNVWGTPTLDPVVDRCPCPVVCMDAASAYAPVWPAGRTAATHGALWEVGTSSADAPYVVR